MTTEIWPSSIKLKIKYGTEFEFGLEGSKAVTEFENGPVIMRQRFTNVPYRMTLDLTFTDAEYELFISWYTNVLLNGVRSFVAPVLVLTTVQPMRCQILNKSIKPVAVDYNRWVVPVVLEIRGPYAVSEGTLWLLEQWGAEVTEDVCDRLQYIINVQYPDIINEWLPT